MTVLIFETNLMWSSRLVQSAKRLGHQPVLLTSAPSEAEQAEAAIVNLGDGGYDARELVQTLKNMRIPVIAHAGHKEKDLLDLGRESGVDLLATNSQLTYKLDELLEQAAAMTQ